MDFGSSMQFHVPPRQPLLVFQGFCESCASWRQPGNKSSGTSDMLITEQGPYGAFTEFAIEKLQCASLSV